MDLTSKKKVKRDHDDHHSYVLSKDYMDFRVNSLVQIYRRRVPKRVCSEQRWQLIIIILGVAIAFITEIEVGLRAKAILILAAIVASFKTYSEFLDVEGYNQLYPPAINVMIIKQME